MQEINKSEIIRNKLARSQSSPFKAYKEMTTGNVSFTKFLYYEVVTSLLGPMPGGFGFYLRKKFYRRLFKKCGKGLILGRNVVIRHPYNIELGDYVTIDDNCVLDGRGDKGIFLENNVLLNRNCMLLAKTGSIKLGARTSIGANSVLVSMSGVFFGEAVLTAGNCYFSAGAYNFDDLETPVMDQVAYSKGPIEIGKHSWFGTSTVVLDGVKIGEGAVIGSCAMVNKDIPAFAIAVGIPAKVQKFRGENSNKHVLINHEHS